MNSEAAKRVIIKPREQVILGVVPGVSRPRTRPTDRVIGHWGELKSTVDNRSVDSVGAGGEIKR